MKPVRPVTAIVFTWCIIILCPFFLRAQDQLHYDLQVNANLPARKFSVQGTLSFLVTTPVADSVVLMLSKCTAPPSIQVRTPGVRIAHTDTTVNRGGDLLYHIQLEKPVQPGSRLEFAYSYERGGAPASCPKGARLYSIDQFIGARVPLYRAPTAQMGSCAARQHAKKPAGGDKSSMRARLSPLEPV